MRLIIFSCIILTISFSAFGQQDELTHGIGMSAEENIKWLTTLKNADKKEQVTMIQERFFKPTGPLIKSDDEDVPVMVVNGIPIHHTMKKGLRYFLATELEAKDVEIEVMDKEPEELLANKRWTGLILMNIINKKKNKKMYKQN
jgi:hypothetical protein